MSTAKACCEIPPVVSNYEPVGTVQNLGDLPVYTVGNKVNTLHERDMLWGELTYYFVLLTLFVASLMTGLQEGHHCDHGYLWFPVGYCV